MNLSGDCQISSVGNCLPCTCRGAEGVVGEVKSVSWGGARTKGEVHKRKLTKRIFLHSDLLTSLTSSLTPLFLRSVNSCCEQMIKKDRELLTNQIVLYTSLTYVKPYHNIFEQFLTNLKPWRICLKDQSYLRIILKRSYPFQSYSMPQKYYRRKSGIRMKRMSSAGYVELRSPST